jgi:hypothetical protein
MHGSMNIKPSINFGIINSITKLHLVGISTESMQFVKEKHNSEELNGSCWSYKDLRGQ